MAKRNNIKASKKRIVRPIVYAKTNGKCWLCWQDLKFEEMTLDHIIPVSKGGGNDRKNLMPAHLKCNQERKDTMTEAAKKMGLMKKVQIKKPKIKLNND